MGRGIVAWFDSEKHYGSITRDDGRDVPVHYSAIASFAGLRTLTVGDLVTFEIKEDREGRIMARGIEFVESAR